MVNGKRRFLTACAAATLACLLGPAGAQTADHYPDRPIRMVVGFPAGGATDVLARLVAQRLGTRLGQSVVVENQPGASGMIATNGVAKARKDGLTLLFASSTHAVYPDLYAKVDFDPVASFTPIGLVAATPYVMVVHPSLPVKSVAELIAYAKAHPGQVDYAGSSPGTAQHLGWELFKRVAQVDMQYIPYKGSSDLLPDLKTGRIQAAIDNVAVMRSHIEDGSLRGIAVTSSEPSAVLPGVPPISATLPGFQTIGWFGVFGPAGLPKPIADRLSAELRAVMGEQDVRDRLLGLGAEARDGSAEALRTLLASEVATWSQVIKDAGIKAQ